MQISKFRWSRVYESAEEELVELLERRRIPARRWTLAEGEEITRDYPVDMQLWCTEGQLTCTVQGKTYSLQPGDVLNVPANLSCSMRGSFGGCACYESVASKSGV